MHRLYAADWQGWGQACTTLIPYTPVRRFHRSTQASRWHCLCFSSTAGSHQGKGDENICKLAMHSVAACLLMYDALQPGLPRSRLPERLHAIERRCLAHWQRLCGRGAAPPCSAGLWAGQARCCGLGGVAYVWTSVQNLLSGQSARGILQLLYCQQACPTPAGDSGCKGQDK